MDKAQKLTYDLWSSMKHRCLSSANPRYSDYGGRGITVCDRWLNFEVFLEDMGAQPSKEYSLDRIDNSGSYEPSNCRWATRAEQARNRRSNVNITHDGVTQCLTDWARSAGIKPSTLKYRLRNGWPMQIALQLKPYPGWKNNRIVLRDA